MQVIFAVPFAFAFNLQEVRFFFEIETIFFLLVFQVTLHFFVFFTLRVFDFLSKEFKEKAKRELNSHDYINVMIYRGIIYFVLSVCIIIAPLMWAMAIITN